MIKICQVGCIYEDHNGDCRSYRQAMKCEEQQSILQEIEELEEQIKIFEMTIDNSCDADEIGDLQDEIQYLEEEIRDLNLRMEEL